ncbi:MAG: glycogen/starch/alpha-glucan phosphorylase [Gammaproteobacteria bacterium]|nr:MAG: glycogen/starch/alpha-glucan phosphorylase [Gammaproteobacteria bacterium]
MLTKSRRGNFKYDLMGMDTEALKRSLANRLEYSAGKDLYTATPRDWFNVLAYAVRDRLIERWMETMRTYYKNDAKRVYYLSMEFLTGRLLHNSLLNLGILEQCEKALHDIGLELREIIDLEPEPALGNGGLGRLAACFLDSMATLGLPGYGYGIRYEFGMFTQHIENGQQVEHPDNWLRYGNPWEFARPEILYPVNFYGRVVEYADDNGRLHHHWVDTEEVLAMAHDMPIPGYGTNTVNNLRLWASKSTRDFNLKYFNDGNYIKAVEDKNASEMISKVLYPDDTTSMGRELRLKQEYLFVSATMQDIMSRFHKTHDAIEDLPERVAIQLNDTHPAIAIPELMRLLMDKHHLEWDPAWDITRRVFAYTNHTLLPEALETWPVRLFETMLPRHLQIIYEINQRFLKQVVHQHPGDFDLMRRLSIVDEDNGKRVRMAHLAIVGSHKVNGVAALHTHLLQTSTFRDFNEFFPGRIINKTNGITPRLWLNQANPGLARLITARIGPHWITQLDELKKLAPLSQDAQFRAEFRAVKRANKERLAGLIRHHLGVTVDANSMFDVQVKRIHEYKRQLLNALRIVALYNRVRANPAAPVTPRTLIFGGKAAPGYALAKLIIKFIADVAEVVNNDPLVAERLKVVFIPNYDVSTALDIIPAADLSEQISTAGTEASGTGNMKLALNGALTIGTLDGANVEIREEVGPDNIFIFGLTAQEAHRLRAGGYSPWEYYQNNPELKQALDMVGAGFFSPDAPDLHRPLVHAMIEGGDRYMVLADFASYMERQDEAAALYGDAEEWSRRAILNVAGAGKFSSDRAVREYAEEVWNVRPVEVKIEAP